MDEAPLVLEESPTEAPDNPDTKNPYKALKRRYDKVQVIATKVQNILDMLAAAMERIHFLVSWRDPIATQVFTFICFLAGVLILSLGLRAVLFFGFFWILRPPFLRKATPPAPVTFFVHLPSKSDQVL